ncbi:hypothetical protein FA09DRAFT_341612 [Tilletiopsis washingtonensis]|uniref:Uncharacterized protein n=1 Tax=Tilletiopsis washingtonensis TaxID=58919 RepID=A0A316Z051_9BASI|nr:hypothetical protein FA09DRAFT_341612 [Tilletiopsis washingtonensis]PWN94889.1 hypothetical protein FA09DRAFT_341612 [Tilletiopsis washingtonensis]
MSSSYDVFPPPPQDAAAPASAPVRRRTKPLPLPEVARAQKQAQTRGLVAGMAAGVGGVAGRTLSAELTALRDSEVRLGRAAADAQPQHGGAAAVAAPRRQPGAGEEEMLAWDMQAGAQQQHEAGVAGLWQYQDTAATTRGDH